MVMNSTSAVAVSIHAVCPVSAAKLGCANISKGNAIIAWVFFRNFLTRGTSNQTSAG